MQTACLYIRVSTDEQAIKGYSQRSQRDRLAKFCQLHSIAIINSVFEDYSAKTFNRPAWSLFLTGLKKNRALRPNLILFTKWDRFSRNIGDAYYMIAQLRELGIAAQAIDQQLDFSIPENKIILAVYLAASEAENERRSLNVRQGIHKAKQEGRWIAHSPLGYKSIVMSDEKKSICPKLPEALLIKRAFSLIADEGQSIKAIFQQMTSLGLKCSKSHFWRIIRNPVYCGKILVPAFENEEPYYVKGIYEPIIAEPLFDKVQELLNTRKRRVVPENEKANHLFLRGFFYCPRCDKRLTGSTSKGKTRYYDYYHCTSTCGFRVRADLINLQFYSEISKLVPDKLYVEQYKNVLLETKKEVFAERSMNQRTFAQNIDRLIERVLKSKELLIHGDIDTEDFLLIKDDCEKRINILGTELQGTALAEKRRKKSLGYAVSTIFHLGKIFREKGFAKKQRILRLILNHHPVLENSLNFYAILDPVVRLIYNIIKPVSLSPLQDNDIGLQDIHNFLVKLALQADALLEE